MLLQRQLKHSYWQCRLHTHHKQVSWSRGFTLGIEHSNELFHCVNEHGKFSEFGFKGWHDGQSVWVIGEVIRKFELELVANLAPKLWRQAMGEGTALFWGSEVVFCNKECGNSDEISVILP